MIKCVCGGDPTERLYDGSSYYIRCRNCGLKVDDYEENSGPIEWIPVEKKWNLIMSGKYRRLE